ncbi:MAG: RIP metalloprotease RseP [Bacteroidia bacterium]|nr:RIP metalloprotease RseP [Bacteroidia bacterium]MCF8426211.1 RIP metalloprotease RseP [Bacteroidia bacterium]MCF8446247.1 RIP metalloprotease RseP [Bacteroidia bacterium]
MQALIMAAQLILGISILVILHEFGHYLAARAFGIKVEKFYLFFDAWGVKLFSVKIGDTEWGIGWLPLGGYVKIAGMIDESMDKEAMKLPAEPWEFRSKPAWQRLIVMIGGVVVNIITGIVIFAMMSYAYGEKYIQNSSVKNGIVPSEMAKEYGFQVGDKLISVNNVPIVRFEEALKIKHILGNGVVYQVDRNGQQVEVKLPSDFVKKFSEAKADFFLPRMHFYVNEITPGYPAEKAGLLPNDIITAVDTNKFEFFDEFQALLKTKAGKEIDLSIQRGNESKILHLMVDEAGKVGFKPDSKDFEYETVNYSFFGSFPAGWNKAVETIDAQIRGWGKIFKGDIAVNKAVQGPIGIAKFYGGEWIWSRFWLFTALISLGLAFMNILPIPALDGGHVIFLLVEMIIGRPLSEKFLERAQYAGMIILLTLMVLIFGNDIWGLFK